jgi:lipopolysaccharide biosynthesis regulator YciM
MLEVLWLLLPVAALSGWFAARRSAAVQGRHRDFADEEYFRGLNYLLDNRPDKAIEVFVRMVEVDQDTVETHLALGNLFRRRGEVDRAIQIHQNLIARSSLNQQQRARALLELGEDYMKAGVYDRAEGLFKELVDQQAFVSQALGHLSTIYQRERDWEAAIAVSHQVEQMAGRSANHETAQFCCELAELAHKRGDEAGAERLVRQARREDRNSVRASLLSARLKMARGRYRSAIRVLKTIETQDPGFIPEILPPLLTSYRALGCEDEAVSYLRGLLERHPTGYLTATLADLYERRQGARVAEEFLIEILRQYPSVPGLRRLMEIKLNDERAVARDHLAPVLEVGRVLLDGTLSYRCSECGFQGRALHWRCPGCQSWNTVRPDDATRHLSVAPQRGAVAAR